jgi:hypothetical protein
MTPAGLSCDRSPYSSAMPGATKASVVVFMTSMVSAIAITTSRAIWVLVILASSSARTPMCDSARALGPADGGYKP